MNSLSKITKLIQLQSNINFEFFSFIGKRQYKIFENFFIEYEINRIDDR